MKKIILIFIIIPSLGIVAYFSLTGKNSTLRKKDTRFALPATENITKIRIASSEYESVMDNTPDGWYINNQPANKQRINDMLMISGLIDAAAPVSESQADSVRCALQTGTEVFFLAGSRCIHAFTLCKWNNRIYGQRERSKKAFRLSVKGYPEIDLIKVFQASPSAWQSNVIMDFPPDDILQVTLTYPAKTKSSFTLKVLDRTHIMLTDADSNNYTGLLNMETAKEYLNFFSAIHYSALPDASTETVKKIHTENILFTLEVKLKSGATFIITGYPKYDPVNAEPDPWQFIATAGNDNYIVLKYNDFDPILVPLDYFLKK